MIGYSMGDSDMPIFDFNFETGVVTYDRRQAVIRGYNAPVVMRELMAQFGAIVSYRRLMDIVKPNGISMAVDKLWLCPRELEHARRVINDALKNIAAPVKVRAVRGKGLRLETTTAQPIENIFHSALSYPVRDDSIAQNAGHS